jgi:microcystin-dependent protein
VALILPNTIANSIPADGDKLDQNFDTIVDWANQDAITADGSTGMNAPLLLPGPPTQTNQAATKGYVDSYVPLGVMWEYAGDTAPANWMLAQGQALSRATYAALFAVVGTRWGAGDGSTTFNLPAMQGRVPLGHYPGGGWAATLGSAGGAADSTLPAHQHPGVDHLHPVNINTGGQSNNHFHMEQLGEVLRRNPFNPTIDIRFGDGFTFPADSVDTSTLSTNWAVQDHGHAVNGATGAADRALTTGSAGGSATNTNLPPFITVNFIVKVS